MRVPPRSLTGRLALVLALALLVAQGVSFVLLARAQDRLATERVAYAASFPLTTSLEAGADDRPRLARFRARRAARRVRVADAAPPGVRLPRVERAVREVLTARDLAVTDVAVTRGAGPDRGGRPRLVVAAQRSDGRWVSTTVPAPPERGPRLTPLAAQTLLIYLALLLPVLWIGRQVARPLGTLTEGARRWRPGAPPAVVPPRAPEDVGDLARAIADMQARIAAADKERDAMLGAIGHDLRTPITSLRLRAEQVADGALRAKMVATLTQMQALLDDTLTLARSGHPEGKPERTDVAGLARQAVATAQAAGQRAALGQAASVAALVHPAALSRALSNLIANAHAYAGGGTVTVRREGDTVVLAVADEGPGLPEGFAPAAFARGEASRSRATGGAGLGLAIARRVAEAHGGRLDLAPRMDGGTVAAIHLPIGGQ